MDDITAKELQEIEDAVDAEIAANGIPSDDELMAEIHAMNKSAIKSDFQRAMGY